MVVFHQVVLNATQDPLEGLSRQHKQLEVSGGANRQSSLHIFEDRNLTEVTSLGQITNWLVPAFCLRTSLETFTFSLLNDEEFVTDVTLFEHEVTFGNELLFEAIDKLHLIIGLEVFEELDMVQVP